MGFSSGFLLPPCEANYPCLFLCFNCYNHRIIHSSQFNTSKSCVERFNMGCTLWRQYSFHPYRYRLLPARCGDFTRPALLVTSCRRAVLFSHSGALHSGGQYHSNPNYSLQNKLEIPNQITLLTDCHSLLYLVGSRNYFISR